MNCCDGQVFARTNGHHSRLRVDIGDVAGTPIGCGIAQVKPFSLTDGEFMHALMFP